MKTTDLNGLEITVTDLDKAIEQADNFKDLQHNPPVPYDKEIQKYWTDIYNKLLDLKSKLNNE
ncbi:3-isopropylmalate dehydratase [Sphingobacterium sp.]|uniref:3-isopropylmalate dehydratase n=1 Tax=Sphingobacterium sp. TaxID=341027 RepID=UPI00258301FB|nr:3-isopropylmalate dehydratase [Sphingobacterium sp.]WET69051.1 MAG: 3-isopropylmalate dehydratase [Sphingobacterium sp.]